MLCHLTDSYLRDDLDAAIAAETAPGVWPLTAYALAYKYDADEAVWIQFGREIAIALNRDYCSVGCSTWYRCVVDPEAPYEEDPAERAERKQQDKQPLDEHPALAEFVREKLRLLKMEQLRTLFSVIQMRFFL